MECSVGSIYKTKLLFPPLLRHIISRMILMLMSEYIPTSVYTQKKRKRGRTSPPNSVAGGVTLWMEIDRVFILDIILIYCG